MKFIHTADWHLGRSLMAVGLIDDQRHALEGLLEIVAGTKADAVIIAGDIYDRASPSAEAVDLLDEILSRLVQDMGVPVIAIAGNHDSPDRVDYGARIFRDRALHIRGTLQHPIDPVILEDAHGPVQFYPVPYCGPVAARLALGADDIATHADVIARCHGEIRAAHPPGTRSVLIAHAFAGGGMESESERPLMVGGTGSVPADSLEGFNYVALGHLHRPQVVSDTVHYSGSLLKYSQSEIDHGKCVKLVEMDATGKCRVDEIPIRARRDLRRITGTLAELLAGAESDPSRDDYVVARLLDADTALNPMQRLRDVYPNTVGLDVPRQEPGASSDTLAVGDHRRLTCLEMFDLFCEKTRDKGLSGEERAVLVETIEALNREEAEQ